MLIPIWACIVVGIFAAIGIALFACILIDELRQGKSTTPHYRLRTTESGYVTGTVTIGRVTRKMTAEEIAKFEKTIEQMTKSVEEATKAVEEPLDRMLRSFDDLFPKGGGGTAQA